MIDKIEKIINDLESENNMISDDMVKHNHTEEVWNYNHGKRISNCIVIAKLHDLVNQILWEESVKQQINERELNVRS